MSIFSAGSWVLLSALASATVFAGPTVPARMVRIEKLVATVPNDAALTLRTPDRDLIRAHRQLTDAFGACADDGNNDFTVAAPRRPPQPVSGNLRAGRTIRQPSL